MVGATLEWIGLNGIIWAEWIRNKDTMAFVLRRRAHHNETFELASFKTFLRVFQVFFCFYAQGLRQTLDAASPTLPSP